MPLEAVMGAREERLGERVRTLREERGWSQGDLLEQARGYLPSGEAFSRVTLSRLENGRQRPRSGTLQAVARALGVSVDYLLEREGATRAVESEPAGPLPRPEFVRIVRRLNDLPRGMRERVAPLLSDLLDVIDEARQWPAQPEDLGFELDEDDRQLDDLMRVSGLDAEARSALWRAIEERTRGRDVTG
jgi:transcriptional regulator with XRE-family HTH domain